MKAKGRDLLPAKLTSAKEIVFFLFLFVFSIKMFCQDPGLLFVQSQHLVCSDD